MITVLSQKDLIDERKLTASISQSNLKKTLGECAEFRALNRMGRKGFSQDRDSMAVSRYPADVYWYIDKYTRGIKDPIERDKIRIRILNQLNRFKTRDGSIM